MSADATFRVLNPDRPARRIRRYGSQLVDCLEELPDAPRHLESLREDLTAGLSTLERLQTTGEADLAATVERLVTVGQRLGLAPVKCRTTLWTSASTNLVSRGIPEALADHTERGATLWRKLVGSGFDTDWTYELSLDDERYQFDRGTEDGYITSLLTPEEATELRAELEPVIPCVEDVYDSLRQDRPVAWFVRVIETVCGFCAQCGPRTPIVYALSV